jgi:hypothetical protein
MVAMKVSLSSAPALPCQRRSGTADVLVIHHRVNVRDDPLVVGALDRADELFLRAPLGRPFSLLLELA